MNRIDSALDMSHFEMSSLKSRNAATTSLARSCRLKRLPKLVTRPTHQFPMGHPYVKATLDVRSLGRAKYSSTAKPNSFREVKQTPVVVGVEPRLGGVVTEGSLKSTEGATVAVEPPFPAEGVIVSAVVGAFVVVVVGTGADVA